MPGAVWTDAQATALGTRPDVYINFEAPPAPLPPPIGGIAAVIAVSDFGPIGEKVDINTSADVTRYLGDTETNLTRAVTEALRQGAARVMFYRVAAGTAAAATLTLDDAVAADALSVTAKYQGTFGNQVSAEVITNLVDTGLKDLNIYVGSTLRETFSAANNTALVAAWAAQGSDLVTLAVVGAASRVLANITATPLVGGVSGTGVVVGDYTAALSEMSQYDFRTIAFDSTDTTIQTAIAAWVTSERDNGHKIIGVLAAPSADNFSTNKTRAAALDHEAIVYVANGYTTGDDDALTPVWAAIGAAGMIAAYGTNSTTSATVRGATAVSRGYTSAEYREALAMGLFVFTNDGRRVKVEEGINTLQAASQVAPKSRDWRKLRYVAIIDEFSNRAGRHLADHFIGKVPNDDRGRDEAVRQVQTILDAMMADQLLERLPRPIAYIDERYTSDDDRVYVGVEAKAIDAIEKFYLSVVV